MPDGRVSLSEPAAYPLLSSSVYVELGGPLGLSVEDGCEINKR